MRSIQVTSENNKQKKTQKTTQKKKEKKRKERQKTQTLHYCAYLQFYGREINCGDISTCCKQKRPHRCRYHAVSLTMIAIFCHIKLQIVKQPDSSSYEQQQGTAGCEWKDPSCSNNHWACLVSGLVYSSILRCHLSSALLYFCLPPRGPSSKGVRLDSC